MDFFLGGRTVKTTVELVGKGQEKQRKLSVLSDDGILNCDADKGRRVSSREEPAPMTQAALARKSVKETDRVDFVKYFGGQVKPEHKKRLKETKPAPPKTCVINDADEAKETTESPVNPEVYSGNIPEGVVVLDCEENSCSVYGRDIDIYLRHRERKYKAALDGGMPAFCKSSKDLVARSKLVNWLIQVVHYFKFSQQTFYLAVSIFDRVVITTSCAYDLQQLVGVASVLIASKMEEYYPASFEKLLAITRSSYTESELCSMERAIYRRIHFEVICEEPVTFMDRFIGAAEKSDDIIFREICFFMMDTIVTDLLYWSNLTSVKSAAAVYSALLVETADDPVHLPNVWTKSMQYYTGYHEGELSELSLAMLEKAGRIVMEPPSEAAKALRKHFLDGVAAKFMSVSRHEGLLTLPVMEQNNVRVALSFLLRKCQADAA